MPLIIEDGSNVAGANSYATRAEIIAYAAARGVILTNDEATDVLAIAAMDYVETRDFKGAPTYGIVGVDQALAFPRQNVVISESIVIDEFTGASSFNPVVLPSDTIPLALKNAQCELAMVKFGGVDLMPVRQAGEGVIKSEKVDVIQTEYFEGSTMVEPFFPRVDALLKPFLAQSVGSGFGLTAVRV